MTSMTIESALKKRLVYDGNGIGEDRRLLNIIKHVTKFCLLDESDEDTSRLFNTISKDLSAAIATSEKYERISQMYDRTFENLEKAIEEEEQHKENVKQELARLELELEYVEKLRKVNTFPDSQATEKTMREIERSKQDLMLKVDRQKANIQSLGEACKNLRQILDYNDNNSHKEDGIEVADIVDMK